MKPSNQERILLTPTAPGLTFSVNPPASVSPPSHEKAHGGASSAKRPAAASPQAATAKRDAPTAGQPALANLHHGDPKRGGSLTTSELEQHLARPWRKLTVDEMHQVLVYLSLGASVRQAAAGVGRNHTVVLRLIERDEYFAAQVARFQQLAALEAVKRVDKAGEKNWRAAAWLLEYLERREERQARAVTKFKAAVAIESETTITPS